MLPLPLSDALITIGANVRALRREQNLTQEELAELCGVDVRARKMALSSPGTTAADFLAPFFTLAVLRGQGSR